MPYLRSVLRFWPVSREKGNADVDSKIENKESGASFDSEYNGNGISDNSVPNDSMLAQRTPNGVQQNGSTFFKSFRNRKMEKGQSRRHTTSVTANGTSGLCRKSQTLDLRKLSNKKAPTNRKKITNGAVKNSNDDTSADKDDDLDDHDDGGDDDGVMSESETAATKTRFKRCNKLAVKRGVTSSAGAQLAVSTNDVAVVTKCANKPFDLVFLQYQGETKRALIPDDIKTLYDVKQLFARAFRSSLTMGYLQSSLVKIYIQDPARQDVFYELDDLSDIKNRSVLKLHEQTRPASPSPHLQQPAYLCESMEARSDSLIRNKSLVSKKTICESDFDDSEDQRINHECDQRQRKTPAAYTYPNAKENVDQTVDSRSRYFKANAQIKTKRYGNDVSLTDQPFRDSGHQDGRSPEATLAALIQTESPYAAYHNPPTDRNYAHMEIQRLPSYSTGASDRSSSVSRCGSTTPIVDEEARLRMMNMESQLANLSSLVHTALMAKAVGDNVHKDIETLRHEILANQVSASVRDEASEKGSVSRYSDISHVYSDSGRGNHTRTLNPNLNRGDYFSSQRSESRNCHAAYETQVQIKTTRKRLADLHHDLTNLRRTVQLNAQSATNILKDAFDQIKLIISANKNLHGFALNLQGQPAAALNTPSSDRVWANQEQERHRNIVKKIESELTEFEKKMEVVRQQVVNGNRRLKLIEVEALTNTLSGIGQTTAGLKTNFPALQQRLQYVMATEMDKVVREEKFLKEEPLRLDSALQRCKKLTGTILTMKKLATVQDRSLTNQKDERERPASATPQPTKEALQMNDVHGSAAPPLPPPPKNYYAPPTRSESDTRLFLLSTSSSNQASKFKNCQDGATSTDSSTRKNIPDKMNNNALLDTLLDELHKVSTEGAVNIDSTQSSTFSKPVVDLAGKFRTAASPASGTSEYANSATRNPAQLTYKRTDLSPANHSSLRDALQPSEKSRNAITVGGRSSSMIRSPQKQQNGRYNSESPQPYQSSPIDHFGTELPKRCQSTTPLAEANRGLFEASFLSNDIVGAPPPPPRSSSRTALNTVLKSNGAAISSPAYTSGQVGEFKRQLSNTDSYRLNDPSPVKVFGSALNESSAVLDSLSMDACVYRNGAVNDSQKNDDYGNNSGSRHLVYAMNAGNEFGPNQSLSANRKLFQQKQQQARERFFDASNINK